MHFFGQVSKHPLARDILIVCCLTPGNLLRRLREDATNDRIPRVQGRSARTQLGVPVLRRKPWGCISELLVSCESRRKGSLRKQVFLTTKSNLIEAFCFAFAIDWIILETAPFYRGSVTVQEWAKLRTCPEPALWL